MRRRAIRCERLKFHSPNNLIAKSEDTICTAVISTCWPDTLYQAADLCFGGP